MRPILLTMTAFGPFAGTETLDFRAATAAGLFGIYGPTGSGKSSIFNAMTFALFGEAAHAEQDVRALRSDHAAAEVATEVSFLFALAGKPYLIRRSPEQMRPKKRGEGMTRSAHEAYLFDAAGLSVEEVMAGAEGRVIEEKKVGLVDDALRDLLGYGSEQFRRIVLLPQGRFEAFLSAKTDERKKILKELFDVSLYGRLAAKLKLDAAEARKAWDAARTAHDARLQAEGFADLPALDAGIVAAEGTAALARQTESEAEIHRRAAAAALEEAKEQEALFAAQDAAMADHTMQEALAPQTAAEEADVARLENAAGLADLAARRAEENAALTNARAAAETAAANARDKADIAAKAETMREAEDAKAEDTAACARARDSLNRHAETLRAAVDLRSAADAAAVQAGVARKAVSGGETAQKTRRDRFRSAAAALKTARQAEAARAVVLEALRALADELKAATAHEAAAAALNDAQQALAIKDAARGKAQGTVCRAGDARSEAEAALSHGQALHLAATLTPGAPCPVCGAQAHPAPATGDPAHADADATFRAAQDKFDAAAKALAAAEVACAAAETLVAERGERFAELPVPPRRAAAAAADLAQRKAERDALATPANIAADEAAQDALSQEIDAAETALAVLRAADADAAGTAGAAHANLKAALSDVPEPLRDPAALAAAQAQAEAELLCRAQAQAAATKAAQDARDDCVTAEVNRVAADNAMAAQDIRANAAAQALTARLAERGLSEAEHDALSPRVPEIPALRAAIAARREARAAAAETLRRAQAAVAELERPDLDAARAADEATETARRLAAEARLTAEAAQTRFHALRDDLARMRARTEAQDVATAPLRDLAALCNGENPQALDLETFALGAMFDRALAAANARLGPMTAGRYSMRRQLDGEGGRGRKGLGIEVSDIFTGRARPTSTLSGGESFIHALALALGLADVVERDGGRVRLDTIFIDEGFGSLDAESGSGTLEQVLDALTALTGGVRAVGLISHVPQVQEAAPCGFTLRKTPSGSRVDVRGREA